MFCLSKKSRNAIGFLMVFLIAIPSCSNTAQLNSKRNELFKVDTISKASKDAIFANIDLKSLKSSENDWLRSPFNEAVNSICLQSYCGSEDAMRVYKTISADFNVKSERFRMESNALVAANSFAEGIEEKLNENFISTFKGNQAEIFEYTRRLFGTGYNVPNELIVNCLEYSDSFSTTLSSKEKHVFYGTKGDASLDYYTITSAMPYIDNGNCLIVSARIDTTSLVFMIPKGDADLNDLDPSLMFDLNDKETKSVSIHFPEFSIADKTSTIVDGRVLYQDNLFQFTRKGVRGKSIVASGPTSSGISDPVDIYIDRPFFFASNYQNIPLMVGQISNI